jgi:hypothetical protein
VIINHDEKIPHPKEAGKEMGENITQREVWTEFYRYTCIRLNKKGIA